MTLFKNKSQPVFDVIPTASSGVLSSNSHESSGELNLREEIQAPKTEIKEEAPPANLSVDSLVGDIQNDYVKEVQDPKKHLESLLNSDVDVMANLASIGAVISRDMAFNNDEPDIRLASSESDELHKRILAQIHAPMPHNISAVLPVIPAVAKSKQPEPVGRIIQEEIVPMLASKKNKAKVPDSEVAEFFLRSAKNEKERVALSLAKASFVQPRKDFNFSSNKKSFWKIWLVLLVISGFAAYGFTLKNEIVKDGGQAFENLQQAKADLERYDFSSAAVSFNKSYEDFIQAGQNLSLMGAGIAGIFSDLPGFSKLKSAKDLTEIGRLLAESGKSMSSALSSLSKTGAILNPGDSHSQKPLAIIGDIRSALNVSERNFEKAKLLVASIDESIIPEDKKEIYGDFKEKIPMLEEYIGTANGFMDFLEGIIGIDKSKKYLLLFNNNSELRPTGGFPGTYGVVSFTGGGLADFYVDDVYNLDGQLKTNVIPPKQLQHITPTWAMRDSSWFSDFPTSSRKAMSYFYQEAGFSVDGVIAVNPDIVTGILKVLGPIKMPNYGLELTADNFVQSIQEEVEYGKNRTQPKTIVKEFAPRFLERLYTADSDKWMKIFNVFMAGLEEKDIMFYFNDKELEKFAIEQGFGGEISKKPGDYLTVNFSNIKGSKTDFVTDSFIEIDNKFADGYAIHKVVITRTHNGGDKEHGFYNRENPAFVRVLMPEDSELMTVSGNDVTSFKPLMNYSLAPDFQKDKDLADFESTFFNSQFDGVTRFSEENKDGVGFWMVVGPGKTKTVTLEYRVPLYNKEGDYSFYFQKQPGLDWKKFRFTVNGNEATVLSPEISRISDTHFIEQELRKDLEIKIKLK